MTGLEQTYAQALFELLERGEKPKEAVHKIHSALEAKGRASLMPAVGKAFERLAQREALRKRSVLVVARKQDEAKARRESTAKDAELQIDETIIGGWKLFDKGTLRDESWKSALVSIYNSATH